MAYTTSLHFLGNLSEDDYGPLLHFLHKDKGSGLPSKSSFLHGTAAGTLTRPATADFHLNLHTTPPGYHARLSRPKCNSAQLSETRTAPSLWCKNTETPPAMEKGHQHHDYRGSTLPEDVVLPQVYDVTSLRRSHVRMNDELVPGPTEVNISERQINVPVPREHPYQSHISRCALFPSLCCWDESGVRATMKKPLAINHMTVLSKGRDGKGFRHEVIDRKEQSRKQAARWPGQHGFYQFPKCVSEEREVFYPSPPKTVLPNPTLRDRDFKLSLRTANMLHNLERTHMLTSYQLDYTGNGPANPVQLDDLHERMTEAAVQKPSPYLRVRSNPVLTPARPKQGRKARLLQGRRPLESRCQPKPHQHGNRSHPDCKAGSGNLCNHFHRDGDNEHDTYKCRYSEWMSNAPEPLEFYFKPEMMLGQSNQCAQFWCEACGSEDATCECQNQRSDKAHSLDPAPCVCKPTLSRKSPKLRDEIQPGCLGGMDGIQLRLPYIDYQGQTRGVFEVLEPCSALRHLQDSFTLSDTQKRVLETMEGGVPDLRDCKHTGRKHLFYDFNPKFFT